MKRWFLVIFSVFVVVGIFSSYGVLFVHADTPIGGPGGDPPIGGPGGDPPIGGPGGDGRETTGKVIGIPNPLCPPGSPNCERSSILGVMNIVLGIILWIATPIAVLMIILAAFKVLSSGGKPETFKEALDQIKWIAIGYAIILVSKSIISEVIRIVNNPTL